MALDEGLLRQAHDAAARWTDTQQRSELAKADYHHAVRQLHLAGASLREIAEALAMSHQRVHQIIEASGGTAGWKPRKKAGADLACTFCGASRAELTKLVAGPGVFICSDCVALAQQVIDEVRSLDVSRTHLDPVPSHSPLTCSFCDKSTGQVARLVAGPGVRICDQCVAFCTEVIAAQPD